MICDGQTAVHDKRPVLRQSEFRGNIATIGFLILSCNLFRSRWAELKYSRILAVGARGSELWLLKVQKKTASPVFPVLKLVMYAYSPWPRLSDDYTAVIHTQYLIL